MTETTQRRPVQDEESDGAMLRRVLDGDIAAYEGIMRRYNQRLFRLARSIVTNDAEAMDVVQESYVKAYEHLADLKQPEALGGWLARIVRNAALMHLRKTRRYQNMEDTEFENVLHLAKPVQQQMRPDRELANAQLRQVLEDCIDELPDAFRAVFMLRAVEQCSVNTCAEMLGIKEATVKTRFHRARVLLQERLLEISDVSTIGVHEFAGDRCDSIVKGVLAEIGRIVGQTRG